VSKDPQNPDRVEIAFTNETYFLADDNKVPLDPEIKLDLIIPQQFPSEEQKSLVQGLTTSIKTASIGGLLLLILLQLVIGSVIKKMWTYFFAV